MEVVSTLVLLWRAAILIIAFTTDRALMLLILQIPISQWLCKDFKGQPISFSWSFLRWIEPLINISNFNAFLLPNSSWGLVRFISFDSNKSVFGISVATSLWPDKLLTQWAFAFMQVVCKVKDSLTHLHDDHIIESFAAYVFASAFKI